MKDSIIIFFDGDCLMCNNAMRLFHRLDDHDRLRFSALSGETAVKHGVPNGETMIVLKEDCQFERSEAVRVILLEVFPVFGFLLSFIPLTLRNWGYDFIAKRRARLSKVAPVCDVPDPAMRAKILP